MNARTREHRMGPGGECICPKCETRIAHQDGMRCQEERCPACGARMLRVGGEDYDLWMKKRQARSSE